MQTKKFVYLPHTADVRFVAYGKTFKESLENAALALLNIMLDLKKIKKKREQARRLSVSERADTPENLVWYTLQDILTKIDEKALCAFEFKIKSMKHKDSKFNMNGVLSYKPSVKGCFLTEVKAVTPYGLEVRKTKRGYEVDVVLDV